MNHLCMFGGDRKIEYKHFVSKNELSKLSKFEDNHVSGFGYPDSRSESKRIDTKNFTIILIPKRGILTVTIIAK